MKKRSKQQIIKRTFGSSVARRKKRADKKIVLKLHPNVPHVEITHELPEPIKTIAHALPHIDEIHFKPTVEPTLLERLKHWISGE